MSVVSALIVLCDGCNARLTTTSRLARHRASSEGWTCDASGDWCPSCSTTDPCSRPAAGNHKQEQENE